MEEGCGREGNGEWGGGRGTRGEEKREGGRERRERKSESEPASEKARERMNMRIHGLIAVLVHNGQCVSCLQDKIASAGCLL